VTPPRWQLVDSDAAFRELVTRLSSEPLLAFDTEAASFHRFTDRVYLIQVSSRSETAVIDPLAVTDLAPVGALLADPDIEVVFHDADFDLRSLDRDYGFRVRRVFDTRIAAQLLGEPGVGLGALLDKHFGLVLNKKFQRADWSQRPLTPDMLAYAAADTATLPQLRDVLREALASRSRLDWATEEFQRLEGIRWSGPDNGEAYLRLKGARLLPPRGLAVLRAMYAWRDEQARALDRATFRIMANEALVALARLTPATPAQLKDVRELPPSIADRYGRVLLERIGAALATPENSWPRFERRPGTRPDRDTEERVERLKRFRNDRARELGIEPGVLCPNGTLEAIARTGGGPAELDTIPELRAWQRVALGAAQLAAALLESERRVEGGAG